MCSYDIIVDFIAVSQLYLYPPTEWWKHLHEDKLFIPDRFIGSFLYSCSTLRKRCNTTFIGEISTNLRNSNLKTCSMASKYYQFEV